MLIHKATMGVLDRIWTGQHTRGPDGILSPVERPASLADVDDPEEWWEIPGSGPLARRVRMYYPWLFPRTGPAGELVGVDILREAEAEPGREEQLQEAQRRGYRWAGRVRPLGLMPFLSCTQTCDRAKKAQE